ncbi:glycoside hydrolase family 2 protein [Micromonospora sp. LOL_021]|uniref:glycoside hydrolase family 2 protein n=1 Tax=Micromonospora sp. LOL_021 TaxID=3345417 RepID=UPI003A89F3BB
MNTVRPLHEGWTVRPADGSDVPDGVGDRSVPAAVPGCVHTDLLAAGLIPDPYLDDNETRLSWIGRADWVYETTFDWADPGDPRVDLVCAGLDTVATVTLNDVELGRTANMHRGYRFDARAALHPGRNTLRVRFDSAYRHAEAVRERLGDRPNAYPEPFNFIRKMACNFGWDWGPNLVTAGIWQEIGLHVWSTARLATVRPLVTVDHTGGTASGTASRSAGDDGSGGVTGRVEVHVDVDRADGADAPLTVVAAVAGARAETVVPAGQRSAVVTLTVAEPELWWPRGYGEPARHALDVTLNRADGSTLDTWQRHIGFRSVRLDTTVDAAGSAFTLVVNEMPVFVRGVNWIPDDAFPTRVDRARYAHRFGQAVEAGVNFLRIWGGGRYESEDFYDLADELGLLVGQDFLFACAAYPQEEPIASEVAAEARYQVARLTPHPSLVLWTGNNENIWGWHDWGWQEVLDGRTWGLGYYLDVLPGIVAELDPTRPYWPGSPYSGRDDLHPNDPSHGTMHIWDVWNTDDYLKYRQYVPRFLAEFGYQGPPAYATLRRAISDDPLTPDSPGMAHHQKAIDGDRKLRRGLDAHLPAPRDFDDWHYLTQLNQARAIAVGVRHFRSHRGVCMGTILWQLNDCWPVTSWAAVDGDGRRKPLWYALRDAYADRLLSIEPRDGGLALVAVNDTGTDWHPQTDVTRLTLTGQPLAKIGYQLAVPAHSAVTVPLVADLTTSGDPRRELLLAAAAGQRAWWFFAEDNEVDYPVAGYDAAVEPTDGGLRVIVTARTILRDLTLYPDRLDPAAEVDRALVTLLPGESTEFVVRTGTELDPVALTSRPVLRCVNDIVSDNPAAGA